MKKPKITFNFIEPGYTSDLKWGLEIWAPEGWLHRSGGHPTRKAAREWAKDWCATVGKALMEKGK